MTRHAVALPTSAAPTLTRSLALALTLAVALGAVSPTAADTAASSATSSVVLEEQAKARRIADPDPLVVVNILEDPLQGSCRLYARQGAKDRKGVKGIFEAALIDANTLLPIGEFDRFKGRTDRNGELVADFAIPQQGNFAQQVALVASVNVAGGKKVTEVHFTCELVDPTP